MRVIESRSPLYLPSSNLQLKGVPALPLLLKPANANLASSSFKPGFFYYPPSSPSHHHRLHHIHILRSDTDQLGYSGLLKEDLSQILIQFEHVFLPFSHKTTSFLFNLLSYVVSVFEI
jgi:hypothetical protein